MIPSFDQKSIREINNLLAVSRKIVITTHHKPDGDAIGSSLALYNFLIRQNHQVTVVTPSEYPDFLQWMPGNGTVVNSDTAGGKAMKLIADAEVIFCLDFNAPSRL